MIGGAMGGEERPKTPDSVLIPQLREAQERYSGQCPFVVGDIITPRASAPIRGRGEPCVVIEVFDPPIRVTHQMNAPGGSEFQAKIDIRVMYETTDMTGERTALMPSCQESFNYEPYVGQTPEPGTPAN